MQARTTWLVFREKKKAFCLIGSQLDSPPTLSKADLSNAAKPGRWRQPTLNFLFVLLFWNLLTPLPVHHLVDRHNHYDGHTTTEIGGGFQFHVCRLLKSLLHSRSSLSLKIDMMLLIFKKNKKNKKSIICFIMYANTVIPFKNFSGIHLYSRVWCEKVTSFFCFV